MSAVALWERLGRVARFAAVTRGDDGAARMEGLVTVDASARRLAFVERGSLTTPAGRRLDTRNTLVWTLEEGAIALAHERFGAGRAVPLVRLREMDNAVFESEAAHVCADDRYACRVRLHDDAIEVEWAITGPRKRMTVTTAYS